MELLLNIILTVLIIATILISYYFYLKKKLLENAESAISEAEDTEEKGKEKMKEAIIQVRQSLPPMIRMMFSDEYIENVIQMVFDRIKKFAEIQVNKKK